MLTCKMQLYWKWYASVLTCRCRLLSSAIIRVHYIVFCLPRANCVISKMLVMVKPHRNMGTCLGLSMTNEMQACHPGWLPLSRLLVLAWLYAVKTLSCEKAIQREI